jgi:hypothetical protein
MGSIGVDQQTWRPAKVADETAPARGAVRAEYAILRKLLYVAFALGVIGAMAPNPVASNHATLIATVALAGLACSCRRFA